MSPAETLQEPVIDFLARSGANNGTQVVRIDTHAAVVFLAGARALKIKRAVRLPFLDYSTLAKRKAACQAENTVNRAYAPSIYRGVVAITQGSDGTLAIGGEGEPVEWAVEMRRFDETQTLDHLADRGRIDDVLADALGRAVATAHELAPVIKTAGFIDKLAEIITQNDAELHTSPDLFEPPAVAELTTVTRAALARVRTLLAVREHSGLVRRCHGDLHLGNIVLCNGEPLLFDAIEFDPAIATGDVLYDLAFLLMDLIERGLTRAANVVFNRYLTQTQRAQDLDALTALPLFMSVRAAIRAKVTAERRTRDVAIKTIESSARSYFSLAGKLLQPAIQTLVAVGGLSGAGKSLLARALGPGIPPLPGAVVLRSDIERKILFGVGETDHLPEAAYSREATTKVYATLGEKAGRVLAAGHSAIVDAVFSDAGERAAIARAASGATFHGLYLTTDLTTRLTRVGSRNRDASDADVRIARAQEEYDLGAINWLMIDASGDPTEALRRATAAVGS
jgi:hypothetical protein